MLVRVRIEPVEPRMVYILLGINLGVYIAGVLATGNPFRLFPSAYFNLYAFTKLVLGVFLPWQIFTSIFLHLDILHIMFNGFFLFVLGTQLERLAGGDKLLQVYILSGLGGNVFSFLLNPYTIVAGASGAIFGIFGYLTMFYGSIGGNIKNMLLYAVFIFIINSLFPGVDIFGHLGGLIVGLLWGYIDGKSFISSVRRLTY